MLEVVLAYLNNWFIVELCKDTFEIKGGVIASELPEGFLQDGQYFRIIGSVFNDGLQKFDHAHNLTDEMFTGTVYSLAVPVALLDLVREIEQWCEKHNEQTQSPYKSESFGGYAYSKEDGAAATWQGVFAKPLNRWRKI